MTQTTFTVRLRSRIAHFIFRIIRPMTLGVRALVIDDQQRVFLVRHSYVPGWHMPGGGVEAGETMLTSLARELAEEGNIEMKGDATLHGVFFNSKASRRDHVAVYIVRDFHQTAPRAPDWEIVEARFFSLDALPPETSEPTRARLAEIFDGRPIAPHW